MAIDKMFQVDEIIDIRYFMEKFSGIIKEFYGAKDNSFIPYVNNAIAQITYGIKRP